MSHLTYLEAVVTGLVQGVTELFPVSSLGHNVLLPALIGGSWASTLNVSAPKSPYLAFIVGLHVATAIAMIAYFWRDWLRIVRGFFSSLRTRSITTPDERLAWMIILATIPVGIVGAALQKVFINVFAKPDLAAVFLAVNGVILLISERMRRSRDAARGARVPVPAGAGAGRPGGGPAGGPQPGGPRPGGPGPEGWQQQPWQQQGQGPGPRHGQDDDWRYGQNGNGQYPENGEQQPPYGQPQPPPYGQPRPPQPGQPRPPQYGQPRHGQPGQPQYGQPQPPPYGQQPYGRDPRGGQPGRGQQQPAGRPGQAGAPGERGGYGERGGPGAGYAPGGRPPGNGPTGGPTGDGPDPAQAADRRLSTIGYKRAVIIGAAQILALLPGISRDGIVTVAGMGRGLRREDAVRFSFLLSAPVILAAGALKAKDLTGPLSAGIHGPILVGSLVAFAGAYLSIRFLTKYFSEDRSLSPFGIYCLIAGLGSLAYLTLK